MIHPQQRKINRSNSLKYLFPYLHTSNHKIGPLIIIDLRSISLIVRINVGDEQAESTWLFDTLNCQDGRPIEL